MATEILSVPESKLLEVIKIIRAGLESLNNDPEISQETKENLIKWCNEEEEYINEIT